MAEEIRIDSSDDVSPFFSSFFESQSEASCYLLGYVFARGRIVQSGDSYILHIQHNLNTINVHRIRDILQVKQHVTPKGALRIHSNNLCNSLISLGMKPTISGKHNIRRIPDMAPNMVHHFVRGYFDGKAIVQLKRPRRDKEEVERDFTLPFAFAKCDCYFLSNTLMERVHEAIVRTGGPSGTMFRRVKLESGITDFIVQYQFTGLKALYWYLYEDATYYDPNSKTQLEALFLTVYEQEDKLFKHWKKYYDDRIDLSKPVWMTLAQWRRLSLEDKHEVNAIERKFIEEDLVYNLYAEHPERINALPEMERRTVLEQIERARIRNSSHRPNNFSL